MKTEENYSRSAAGRQEQLPGNLKQEPGMKGQVTGMPEQLLKDPKQIPEDLLFQTILVPEVYALMNKLSQEIAAAGLSLEWRYYNDGKAWLGKTVYKKKTVVWLSVWDQFIKAGFYFSEKTGPGIFDLSINETIKSSFATAQPTGKLLPLILVIRDKAVLRDFLVVLEYKKNLK